MDNELAIFSVQKRWPELAEKLASVPLTKQVELVKRENIETLLIDNIHISSLYDPIAEAKQQSSRIDKTARQVWLYGLGNGELARELLARHDLQKLHIVILNLEVLGYCLNAFILDDILAHEKVTLTLANESDDVMFPFAAIPPCLRLADATCFKLRDQVLLELTTPYINEQFAEQREHHLKQIDDNFEHVFNDHSLADMLKQAENKNIAVIASGPSLSDSLPQLARERDNYFILAVFTAMVPLKQHAIKPDAVIVIDPVRDDVLHELDKADLNYYQDIPLIYFPVVHQDVLSSWPGPRYVSYGKNSLYDGVANKLNRPRLFSAGSVVHAATDFAIKAHPKSVTFYGADFSYPNKRSHAENTYHTESIEFNPVIHSEVFNGYGKKVISATNLRGFLRDLERMLEANNTIPFYNASKQGAQISGTQYL